MEKTEHIALSITFSSEMSQELKERAKENQVSQAVLIRQAVRAYLDGAPQKKSASTENLVTTLETRVKTLDDAISRMTVESIRASDRLSATRA